MFYNIAKDHLHNYREVMVLVWTDNILNKKNKELHHL